MKTFTSWFQHHSGTIINAYSDEEICEYVKNCLNEERNSRRQVFIEDELDE